MEEALRIFAAINFLIIGLSHIFQHRTWAEFFLRLYKKGKPGAFMNGYLSLITGTLIVAFHNVWVGLPVILTVLGWTFVLKATVTFLNPEWALKSMSRVEKKDSRLFIVPGIFMVVVGGLLVYSVL